MSNIGKITITVSTTQNSQTLAIRTIGKRGPTLLNTINLNSTTASQSPFDTAANFWHDVLVKAGLAF